VPADALPTSTLEEKYFCKALAEAIAALSERATLVLSLN